METGHNINSLELRRRNRSVHKEPCCSGGSRVPSKVWVSFALLCIIQAALNVALRLNAVGFSRSSTSNSTLMSADQIVGLISKNGQLLTARLLQGRDLLNELNQLQTQIQELKNICRARQIGPNCPSGWQPYKLSCYHFSSVRQTWDYAKQDCETKGAHLVILSDSLEEEVVFAFGGGIEIWIGRAVEINPSTGQWRSTWMDGSPHRYNNWNDHSASVWLREGPGRGCVSVNSTPSSCMWFINECNELKHWMCEKERIG